MAGRDTFKDWYTWTEVVLTFTDGTSVSYSNDNTEVYEPFEYATITENGTPLPAGSLCVGCFEDAHGYEPEMGDEATTFAPGSRSPM